MDVQLAGDDAFVLVQLARASAAARTGAASAVGRIPVVLPRGGGRVEFRQRARRRREKAAPQTAAPASATSATPPAPPASLQPHPLLGDAVGSGSAPTGPASPTRFWPAQLPGAAAPPSESSRVGHSLV